ncbi:MAG: ABC transporter substrate-binding protein, partial [Chloroflexota bacterium]
RRNEDENSGMAQVIKSALLADSTNPVHFKEVIYSSKGWNGIVKSLSTTAPNIVVIMTADKAVLPALLRDLSAKADGQNISVVGLAEWEEMELDYNYLIKLNAHFFKPWFVDYQSPAAKNFIKAYRDRYAGEPEVEKYAYLGYDATLFFLQSIYKYGNGFLNCIESQSYNGLSSDFQFIKTSNGGFENFGTSVFKYTEFKREKLN